MRMFKLDVIPGWLIFILGGCWNLFGIWARIEFILKKLWPEESIMSSFTAIASSPWFPFVLMLIGVMDMVNTRHTALPKPTKEEEPIKPESPPSNVQPVLDHLQDNDFVSLKEACEEID